MIQTAQMQGLKITVEAYPYGAGSTGIGATFLAPENLPRLGMTYESIEYGEEGVERADFQGVAATRAWRNRRRALFGTPSRPGPARYLEPVPRCRHRVRLDALAQHKDPRGGGGRRVAAAGRCLCPSAQRRRLRPILRSICARAQDHRPMPSSRPHPGPRNLCKSSCRR